MRYRIELLEKMLDRKYKTIKTYLSRAEFSHIIIETFTHGKYVVNITEHDILRLRDLITRRSTNKYKKIK